MPGFMINGTGNDNVRVDPKVDPLRTYRWTLNNFTNSHGSIAFDRTPYYGYVELQLPEMEFEELQIKGVSSPYKFAKLASFKDIDISFYGYPNLQFEIEKWMSSVWNPEEGLKSDYKGRMSFSQLDNAGNRIDEFTLYNAWPKKLSHSRLSMADSDIKKISIVVSYDWYTYISATGAMNMISEISDFISTDSSTMSGAPNIPGNFA